MPGTTSLTSAWAATRSTSTSRAKASGSISANGRRSRSPTLCTRMSTGPADGIAWRIAVRSAMSKTTGAAENPAARSASSRGASRSTGAAVQQHAGAGLRQGLARSPIPARVPIRSPARCGRRAGTDREKSTRGGPRLERFEMHAGDRWVLRQGTMIAGQRNPSCYCSGREQRRVRMLQLPKVIGHRGAAAYAPENTLDSFPRGEAPRRRLGRDRRQAHRRRRARPDARRVAQAYDGCRPAGRRDAARRAAGGGADLRGGDRLLRPSWGWAATSRSSPARPRGGDRAGGGRDVAPVLAGQPADAAAVELQGRVAGGRPSGGAGTRRGRC